ncbi:hypothetical protein CYY_006156 [Polysphondylium violaceum]|uniref:Sphingomyelin phosphodiesterase n=1 Tax=Polysphondylium violaceum TaxID=133409 RepID=A0A8J4V680_9MYCE|nr:hypothetical protein CYY_006156 [Polysphondylium violaceum]
MIYSRKYFGIIVLLFFIQSAFSISQHHDYQIPIKVANDRLIDEHGNINAESIFNSDLVGLSITCDICKFGIKELESMIQTKKDDNEIMDFAVDLCTLLRIEKPEVCQGLLPLYRNETFQVLGNPLCTPEFVCGFVGLCPYNPTNFTGIVHFPKPKPPHVDPVPPAKGNPVKRILHLSDVHVDTLYVEGMNSDCGEPICCRAANGPGSGEKAAGKWGSYTCDVNMLTLNSMFEFIDNEIGDIDILFWTGDNPPHDIWMQTFETQLNASLRITNLLKQYFPKAQIFPSIGNHESLPVNSFPLPPGSSWLFDALSQDWTNWLGEEAALETLRYGGYYTLPLQEGIRVISLNMNWCNNENIWLIENVTDAADMLQWTIQVLQSAEDIGEKVYIVGHIPPGILDCIDLWSQQFYQIVNRYEDTIISLFFGHTHRDQFEVFYTNDTSYSTGQRPSAVAYVTPSVTTFQYQNPSFRIYSVDAKSGQLVETSTYHLDILDANQYDKPNWVLEYNTTVAYSMPDLLPISWDNLIDRFGRNQTLFNTYYQHVYSSSPYPQQKPCGDSCRLDTICQMKAGTHSVYKECLHTQKSNFLTKSPIELLIELIDHVYTSLKSC